MSIRDAIDGLLDPEHSNSGDAKAALADEGQQELPSDLFGTALGHFADTAPIETADALAPIVTRTGPVPFESTDLSGYESPEGDTAYELFDAIEPAQHLTPLNDTSLEPEVADDQPDDADLDDADLDDDPDLDDSHQVFADFGTDYGDEPDGDHDFDSDPAPQPAPSTLAPEPEPEPEPEGFGQGMTETVADVTSPIDSPQPADAAVAGYDTSTVGQSMTTEPLEEAELGSALDDDLEGIDSVDLFSVSFDDATDSAQDLDPDDLDWAE